jgi:hypothetical protein
MWALYKNGTKNMFQPKFLEISVTKDKSAYEPTETNQHQPNQQKPTNTNRSLWHAARWRPQALAMARSQLFESVDKPDANDDDDDFFPSK